MALTEEQEQNNEQMYQHVIERLKVINGLVLQACIAKETALDVFSCTILSHLHDVNGVDTRRAVTVLVIKDAVPILAAIKNAGVRELELEAIKAFLGFVPEFVAPNSTTNYTC